MALGFCNVYEDGATEPRTGSAVMPELVVVHVPRTELEILDTWDVSGLCATGSHDVVSDDVFVPEAFV
jgi:alkylation response protein AidB-like acyl-CoA dehydrogenase